MDAVHRLNNQGQVRLTHRYLTRDPSGRITKTQLVGFAGEVTYKHDLLGRLQHMFHPEFEEEVPTNGYDPIGNLLCVQQRDSISQGERTYSYDALYQLVREEGITSHNYTYDSVFNRLQADEASCDIDALNQLVRQGNVRYAYDSRGRRIGMYPSDPQKESTYKYDALGRLIQVSSEGTTWHYLYDAFNRRITRTAYDKNDNQLEIHHYLYHGQCEIGRADAQNTITELRVLGEGMGAELGAAVAIEIAGRAYAPLHDHNGNLVALLSIYNGAVAEAYRYTAFGEEQCFLSEPYTCEHIQPCPLSPWRLSSKRVDTETQWVYFGRRHYDPLTGRWTAPDPHSYTDGPNLYTYVLNSPISHFDLYGLRTEKALTA